MDKGMDNRAGQSHSASQCHLRLGGAGFTPGNRCRIFRWLRRLLHDNLSFRRARASSQCCRPANSAAGLDHVSTPSFLPAIGKWP
jgi:hypothetical protein